MTDSTERLLPVEQSDRELAYGMIFSAQTASEVLNGNRDDHAFVQAFARHRLAERERCAKVAEGSLWLDTRHAIASAIRSGKEPA